MVPTQEKAHSLVRVNAKGQSGDCHRPNPPERPVPQPFNGVRILLCCSPLVAPVVRPQPGHSPSLRPQAALALNTGMVNAASRGTISTPRRLHRAHLSAVLVTIRLIGECSLHFHPRSYPDAPSATVAVAGTGAFGPYMQREEEVRLSSSSTMLVTAVMRVWYIFATGAGCLETCQRASALTTGTDGWVQYCRTLAEIEISTA